MKVLKVLSVETLEKKLVEKYTPESNIRVLYIGSVYHFNRLHEFIHNSELPVYPWLNMGTGNTKYIQELVGNVTIVIDQILPKEKFISICNVVKGCGYDLIFGPQTNYTEEDLPWCGGKVFNENLKGPDKQVSKNSDDHYRDIEGNSQTEPIVVMEELNDRLFKAGIPSESALNIVLAQKHLTRAGIKKGDSWEKDVNKAINYLTRAVTGEWIKHDKTPSQEEVDTMVVDLSKKLSPLEQYFFVAGFQECQKLLSGNHD